jgi:hypothetical protein
VRLPVAVAPQGGKSIEQPVNLKAKQVLGKNRGSVLQGLKPIPSTCFTPGLKPRPPKEETLSATYKGVSKGSIPTSGWKALKEQGFFASVPKIGVFVV